MDNELKPGEVLEGRYKIQGVAGHGAYGVVYRAEDSKTPGAIWAVKEISESHLSDGERQEALDLFRSEALLLKSLNHTGVPKTIDSFSRGSLHYLVMEYIEGESLEHIAENKSLTPEEVVDYAIKLCSILDYLHNNQAGPVVFRDLKPSNVMVTSRGRVILIDFGTARLFNPLKTRDTVCLGTPGFCAPEQYGTRQSDPRSDVYGLGATIYYLLSQEDLSKYNFHLPALTSLNHSVSRGLEAAVARAVQIDMEKRFSTIEEFRHELQSLRDTNNINSLSSPAGQVTLQVSAAPMSIQNPGASISPHTALPPLQTAPQQMPSGAAGTNMTQYIALIFLAYLISTTIGLASEFFSVLSTLFFLAAIGFVIVYVPLYAASRKYADIIFLIILTVGAVLLNLHFSYVCTTIPGVCKVGLFVYLYQH
ncbi:MAG: serine/threonine protein kinase [Candidatus Xenobiia bacterium LiM19]